MEQVQNLNSLFTGSQQLTQPGLLDGSNPSMRFRPHRWPNRPSVSVIIPTLNEAKNLPLVLPFLPLDWIDEVILVDGRSTDGTVEIALKLLPSIKVVLEKKRGKGAALLSGYKASKGDILVVIDADGSNDPREVPRYIGILLQGADMVKGSRFAHGGGTTDMPRIRKLGNQCFVHIVNLMFGCKWTDLCYGYHAFWRHCLSDIDLSGVDGFEIDTALYLRAVRIQLHIAEVPSFEGYRFHGEGKLKTLPDGWRVLKTILKEWVSYLRQPKWRHHLGFRGMVPAYASLSSSSTDSSIQSIPRTEVKSSKEVDDGNSNSFEQVHFNLQIFRTVSLILAAGYSHNNLLKHTLSLSMQTIQADSGSIVILDEDGNVRESYLAYNGEIQATENASLGDILNHGLAGWAIKNQQPVVVHNTFEDPRWLRRSWEDQPGCARSAVAVPLMVSGMVIGVLTLVRPQAQKFTIDDLALLEYLYGKF